MILDAARGSIPSCAGLHIANLRQTRTFWFLENITSRFCVIFCVWLSGYWFFRECQNPMPAGLWCFTCVILVVHRGFHFWSKKWGVQVSHEISWGMNVRYLSHRLKKGQTIMLWKCFWRNTLVAGVSGSWHEVAHMGGLASLHMRGLAVQAGSSCEVLAELLWSFNSSTDRTSRWRICGQDARWDATILINFLLWEPTARNSNYIHFASTDSIWQPVRTLSSLIGEMTQPTLLHLSCPKKTRLLFLDEDGQWQASQGNCVCCARPLCWAFVYYCRSLREPLEDVCWCFPSSLSSLLCFSPSRFPLCQVRVGDPGQAVAFVMDPATGQANWSCLVLPIFREFQPESLVEAVCLVDPCRICWCRRDGRSQRFFFTFDLLRIADDRRKRSRSTVWWLMIFDHQSFTTNRRLICWLGGYDVCVTLATSCNTQMRIPPPWSIMFASVHSLKKLAFFEDYLASRVDSWCLGWNTFYLLTSAPWPNSLVSQIEQSLDSAFISFKVQTSSRRINSFANQVPLFKSSAGVPGARWRRIRWEKMLRSDLLSVAWYKGH